MSTAKSTYWSITINNPSEQDDENIRLCLQKGWKLSGQKEAGENGTIHYQAMLHTPNQVRFSAVKKALPRAHIEIAKNPLALKQYVQKEETRVGELPEQSEYYPSLTKLWQLITEYYTSCEKWNLNLNQIEEGKIEWYQESQQRLWNRDKLQFLDQAIRYLITQGYHVESIAANPATRSMWKLYAESIILRSYHEINNRNTTQNDRNGSDEEESISTESQSAEIPVTSEESLSINYPCSEDGTPS